MLNIRPELLTQRHLDAAAERAWKWYRSYETYDNLECAGAQVALSMAQRASDGARECARALGLQEPSLPCP